LARLSVTNCPVYPGLSRQTHSFFLDVKGKPCEDHCILQHSNRVRVITLAGSHPVLQSGKVIKSISYQISTNCSRLQNKVSGKFKWVCSCISLLKSSIVIIMIEPASLRTQ
uniref:Uncharacterized protein n=1 Tax=Monodon monoceros TaxID=40151 RepID=A0A8C6AHV0_MONMO